MTRKEIEAMQRSLPPRLDWANWTEEQKKLDAELSCREMINSCLCYGTISLCYGTMSHFWEEKTWGDGKPLADRYVAKLGVTRVREICKEQEEDFARAVVLRNVYTDSDGLSYNSIVWADELEERGA